MYNYPTTGIRNALMMTPTGQQAIQRYQFGGQTTTGGGLSDASIEDILAGRARFYNPLSYRDAKEEEISETLVGTSAEDPYLRRKKIIPSEDRGGDGGDGGDPTLPVERTAENNFGWLDPFEKGLVSMFPFGSGPLMAAANQQAAVEKALGEYGSKHAPSMVDFLSYGLTDSSGLYDKVDEIMSNRNIAGRRSTGPFGEEKIDYTYQYEEPEEPLSIDLGGRVSGTGGSGDVGTSPFGSLTYDEGDTYSIYAPDVGIEEPVFASEVPITAPVIADTNPVVKKLLTETQAPKKFDFDTNWHKDFATKTYGELQDVLPWRFRSEIGSQFDVQPQTWNKLDVKTRQGILSAIKSSYDYLSTPMATSGPTLHSSKPIEYGGLTSLPRSGVDYSGSAAGPTMFGDVSGVTSRGIEALEGPEAAAVYGGGSDDYGAGGYGGDGMDFGGLGDYGGDEMGEGVF